MFSSLAVLVAVLLGIGFEVSGDDVWSYRGSNGPNSWANHYPDCGGQRQSPIDLTDFTLTQSPKLSWSGYGKLPRTMTLKNNGHSVELTGTGSRPQITLDNGKIFQLANVHFHWGKKNSEGSEHTLEGVRYTMEMHAVHLLLASDGTFARPTEAIGVTSFFQISLSGDLGLDRFITYMPLVVKADTSTSILPFAWSKLIPEFTDNFYWYKGSLTTPNCSEVVTFFIQRNVRKVSANQMALFRTLLNEENTPLSGNCRPLQNRNNRAIYYYNC